MRNNERVRVKLRPTPWWVVSRGNGEGGDGTGGGHVPSPLQRLEQRLTLVIAEPGDDVRLQCCSAGCRPHLGVTVPHHRGAPRPYGTFEHGRSGRRLLEVGDRLDADHDPGV
jgi:hypothetical protein